ncbi:MAG: carbohydrate kinase [Methyloglobulus sp.]|nr:carbohydrate kinase [Methyloglobulus sp.]
MNTDFYAFGELLWDCLPSGRHGGGAPFNVAAHLAQLGVSASLISAVGQDALGDELLSLASTKNVDITCVSYARPELPTGTVIATVDGNGNATYEIVQPVAWDEIQVPDQVLKDLANAQAFAFGSLACRSSYNLRQLDRLLAVQGSIKFFDVNLRPPFVDPNLIIQLAKRADVIKLNDSEIGLLTSWLQMGEEKAVLPKGAKAISEACEIFAEATNVSRICVTLAEEGAAFWERGMPLIMASAPHVVVKDTVGAGDAFMAGLMLGLTQGTDTRTVLETACRLGAFVASHNGAIPSLPPEFGEKFKFS